MRLFIAIELPEEVRDYLFSINNNFKNKAKVNWIAKKNIHLTLKFLGNVDEKLINELISLLDEIKFEKFELELDGLGIFPNENNIRILWVGVKNFNKVIELQQEIDESLSKHFQKEKEFSAHITIGRIKAIRDKKPFLENLDLDVKKIRFPIDGFSLFKSELSKDGPKYTRIKSFQN